MDRKILHDFLISINPDADNHDAACIYCQSPGGEMDTFSKEEVDAAIAAATADLRANLESVSAELASLKSAQSDADVESRIATAVAELETKVSELEAQLDAANVALTAEQAKYADLVSVLEAAEADRIAKEEAAARKEARLSLVKEMAIFSDDHIAENIERWAEMSDEAFETVVEGWKEIDAAVKADAPKIDTAFVNTRTTTPQTANTSADMRKVFHAVRTSRV